MCTEQNRMKQSDSNQEHLTNQLTTEVYIAQEHTTDTKKLKQEHNLNNSLNREKRLGAETNNDKHNI